MADKGADVTTAAPAGAAVRAVIEWPTLLLCLVVYGGWAALTWWHDRLPIALVVALGAWLIAWHSSLQHEILHGHPTRWGTVNRVLGSIPLSLWLSYESYGLSHLVHHRDERLTDPLDDPETNYWTAEAWARLTPVWRGLARFHATLVGRLLIGPAWAVGRYFKGEWGAILADVPGTRRLWALHGLHVIPVILWLVVACRMNLAFYLSAMVYPGTSLLLVRSFAEHRAACAIGERTAIVEKSWILGPLFLFNNLHAAHHRRPMIPWYELPRWYRAHRESLIRENGGLVYNGYFDVARRYWLTPPDSLPHPLGRAPHADGSFPPP